MRKTKVVATIGPASNDTQTLQQLADAGMDVARQNFSHGSHSEHKDILQNVRSLDQDVAAMMDTQGPEIRTGEMEDQVILNHGDTVTIMTDNITGDQNTVPVKHNDFLDHIETGDNILIDDGIIELVVDHIDTTAKCTVRFGGKLGSHKSITVPGKDMGLPPLTEKDLNDIAFGAEQDFDFISASFIKSADDVRAIKEILNSHSADMDIIAKIEHTKAVENFDSILEAADGIMVARGDLGVELPTAEVPVLQKKIIKKCNKAGKPVITATQMLKSMTENPTATRAEVSDVANAVEDGTDAVMLSEETAVGNYPRKSVEFMCKTVEHMEGAIEYTDEHHAHKSSHTAIPDIICRNVWQASVETDVRYIIAHTSSGYTAKNIAKYRPDTDIIAFTENQKVKQKLQLVWGVTPIQHSFPGHLDEMIDNSVKYLDDRDAVSSDDILVMTAGVPLNVSGTTNMLEIRKVKEVLAEDNREEMLDRSL